MNRLPPLRRVRISLRPSLLPKSSPVPRFYASKPPPANSNDPTPRLSQPSRFTLPSHPSRAEFESQRRHQQPNFPLNPPPTSSPGKQQYPNTLPPEGTLSHWFITSRRLHFYLSLSILFTLAAIVSVTNFLKTSPYTHLVPAWDWMHPADGISGFLGALKMHMENKSRLAEERRKERGREIERRGEYRRKHGLERTGEEGGLGGWGLKREEDEAASERQLKDTEGR